MPSVIYVITTHDHRAFALQALASALGQDYPAELLEAARHLLAAPIRSSAAAGGRRLRTGA